MKLSKKLRVLRGVTHIRVKMGVSQLALAQYLGVSKSTISMVENGHRRLPGAASYKLVELELDFHKRSIQPNDPLYKLPACSESELEKAIRKGRERVNGITLELMRIRLARMTLRYKETLEEIRHLDLVINFAKLQTPAFHLLSLEQARPPLLKKLKRCDAQARAKIEGKIAMLQIVEASYLTQPVEDKEVLPADSSLIAENKQALPRESSPEAGNRQLLPEGYRLNIKNIPYSSSFSITRLLPCNTKYKMMNVVKTPRPMSAALGSSMAMLVPTNKYARINMTGISGNNFIL